MDSPSNSCSETPRIAVCLYGQLRTWPWCRRALARHVVASSGGAVDVFGHTWDEPAADAKLNSQVIRFEDLSVTRWDVGEMDLDERAISRRVMSMWTSIERSWARAAAHAAARAFEYDVVVFARWDCLWTSAWDLRRIPRGVGRVYCPDGHYYLGGVNDLLIIAVGHSTAARIAALASDCIGHLRLGSTGHCSEYMLAFHCEHSRLDVQPLGGPRDYGILRNPTCDPMDATHGHRRLFVLRPANPYETWQCDYARMARMPNGTRWLHEYVVAHGAYMRGPDRDERYVGHLNSRWFNRMDLLTPVDWLDDNELIRPGYDWWSLPPQANPHAALDALVLRQTEFSNLSAFGCSALISEQLD